MGLKQLLLIVAVAGLVLGVPVVLATGAFSSATLEREATVNVASDSDGLLALRDGHPGQDIVAEKSSGTLGIDLTTGNAAGVNHEGTFTIGQTTNPTGNHAFRVVHQGTQPSDITFDYSLSSSDPQPGVPNLEFTFYDELGNHLGTMSEESPTTINSVQPGETVYVVIEIDTRDVSGGSDLSGSLDISAA